MDFTSVPIQLFWFLRERENANQDKTSKLRETVDLVIEQKMNKLPAT